MIKTRLRLKIICNFALIVCLCISCNFVIGQSNSRLGGIDTLLVSSNSIVMCVDHFFNPLAQEEVVLPDINDGNPFVREELKTNSECFLVICFLKEKSFVIFREDTPIYYGEGFFGELVGKHKFETYFTLVEGIFVNRKLQGELTYKNKINKKTTIKHYNNGELNGDLVTKDSTGNITYYCRYKDDLKDGLEFELHENHMLSYYYHYNLGKLQDGKYYTYDENGNVTITKTIKDSELINIIFH